MTAVNHAARGRGGFAAAVFALDSWLRRRHGVFEYSDSPQCIFRIQRSAAAHEVRLSDGVAISPGAPLLTLHVWNEHMPAMGSEGVNLVWAKHLSRAIDHSLRLLYRYLRDHADDYREVAAICADMHLGPAMQAGLLEQISRRFGFERVGGRRDQPSRGLARIGEGIFMLMLVAAANPRSARLSVLRREPMTAYLSRRVLEQRYCDVAPDPGGKAR